MQKKKLFEEKSPNVIRTIIREKSPYFWIKNLSKNGKKKIENVKI